MKGREYVRNEEKGYTHGTKALENGPCGKQDHTIRDPIQYVDKQTEKDSRERVKGSKTEVSNVGWL